MGPWLTPRRVLVYRRVHRPDESLAHRIRVLRDLIRTEGAGRFVVVTAV